MNETPQWVAMPLLDSKMPRTSAYTSSGVGNVCSLMQSAEMLRLYLLGLSCVAGSTPSWSAQRHLAACPTALTYTVQSDCRGKLFALTPPNARNCIEAVFAAAEAL